MRAIEMEECDECGRNVTIDMLWRVWPVGLLCARCVEELIEAERDQ